MTGKHYRWQTRWVVNVDEAQARHDSGLVVTFPRVAGQIEPQLIDAPEILARLTQQHGPHNIGPMLERWKREARQLYREAIDARP